MKHLIIFAILFTSCAKEEVLPTCDWVEAKIEGSRVRIKINSQSEMVTSSHEYPDRTIVFRHTKPFYSCISMPLRYGEIITFTDGNKSCIVEAMSFKGLAR